MGVIITTYPSPGIPSSKWCIKLQVVLPSRIPVMPPGFQRFTSCRHMLHVACGQRHVPETHEVPWSRFLLDICCPCPFFCWPGKNNGEKHMCFGKAWHFEDGKDFLFKARSACFFLAKKEIKEIRSEYNIPWIELGFFLWKLVEQEWGNTTIVPLVFQIHPEV